MTKITLAAVLRRETLKLMKAKKAMKSKKTTKINQTTEMQPSAAAAPAPSAADAPAPSAAAAPAPKTAVAYTSWHPPPSKPWDAALRRR